MNKLANAKRLTAEIAKGLANNGYDVKADRLNDYATEITVEGRYKIGVTVNAGYPVVYNYLTGNSYGGDEYDTMNSMAAAMSRIMKNAIFRHLVKKPEGRTITVTLHPEDEEEERTITYTGVKSISIATGKAAERIEAHTDESSIDKDHEYMVIIFEDRSKATFRRSSVVKVQEEGKLPVIEEDEPTAEEPQPTPEEADREVTYIDFKPEQDYSEEEQKEIAETVAGVGLELLEKELTELEKLEEESDKADDAWDKDPLNAELEAASSKAYEKEWKKYMDAAKTLARLINMDTKTARQMLLRGSKNREKVWNYLKRMKVYENK